MFHEVTYEEERRRRRRGVWALAGTVAAVALVAALLNVAGAIRRAQGTATLRQAVIDAALQCRAVEGSYPSTLEHLEEHYGLLVDENDYAVSYQWLGDNIVPNVAVRPL